MLQDTICLLFFSLSFLSQTWGFIPNWVRFCVCNCTHCQYLCMQCSLIFRVLHGDLRMCANVLNTTCFSKPKRCSKTVFMEETWCFITPQDRSKTHKRLKEPFLMTRNRTKRANFRCNHLFRAMYLSLIHI